MGAEARSKRLSPTGIGGLSRFLLLGISSWTVFLAALAGPLAAQQPQVAQAPD